MMTIIYASAVLGGLGLVFGILLAVFNQVFSVPVDTRAAAVLEVLPGANCGGCGHPGCEAFAQAVVEGKAPVNGCPVGGPELAAKLGTMMGVNPGDTKRMAATVNCQGTAERCKPKFRYQGMSDCLSASLISGGSKACEYACLGLGTCAAACPFEAIRVDSRLRIAVVDPDKCTGCQVCVAACPKKVLSMQPVDAPVRILCHAALEGKPTGGNCKAGCVSCDRCGEACRFGAITMVNHLPTIDLEKCTGCLMCAEVCPTEAILGDFDNRMEAAIDRDTCIGCGICKKQCQFEAISGKLKQPHIITGACTGCGACEAKCPKDCISMRVRRYPRDGVAEAGAKAV